MILLIFSTFLPTWNVEVRAIVKDLDQVDNADSLLTFFFYQQNGQSGLEF